MLIRRFDKSGWMYGECENNSKTQIFLCIGKHLLQGGQETST